MEERIGPARPGLSEVRIEGLYGASGEIIIPTKAQRASNPISLLYGDNGSGKTTVLKLIYAALASEKNSGHRGYLGRANFRQLKAIFEDGQVIEVKKEESGWTSTYTFEFHGPRAEHIFDIRLAEGGNVPVSLNPEIARLTELLRLISPPLVFLSDYRTIQSCNTGWEIGELNYKEARSSFDPRVAWDEWEDRQTHRPYGSKAGIEALSTLALRKLLDLGQRSLLSSAMSNNTRANTEAGQIYLQIAKTITNPGFGRVKSNISVEKGTLLDRLTRLMSASELQARFGLMDVKSIPDLISILQATSDEQSLSALIPIIQPYVASIEQRIEANANLAFVMQTFSDKMNTYFRRKSMTLNVFSPFVISNERGYQLDVSMLSSGEKHLLSMFTVALLSREPNTTVLIDEPEISLNYIWQRNIAQSLLDISGGQTQFVLASHSFEVISAFRENVVNISDI